MPVLSAQVDLDMVHRPTLSAWPDNGRCGFALSWGDAYADPVWMLDVTFDPAPGWLIDLAVRIDDRAPRRRLRRFHKEWSSRG